MHYLKNIIISITVLFPVLVSAQQIYTITGRVQDFTTGKPVPDAMVFINNTTKGCLTDSAGSFTLSQVEERCFDLVVLAGGHEELVYPFSPGNRNKKIVFEMMHRPVDSSLIKSGKNSETDLKKWQNVFIDGFLGGSVNAEQCDIINPQVLRFRYDTLDRVLLVTSTEPLQIFNESLGYKIICQVSRWEITARNEVLANMSYSWFKESVTRRKDISAKWKINRVNTYEGSLQHFMQAFYAGRLQQEGFVLKTVTRIYENDNRAAYQEALTISENVSGREVNRIPGEKLYRISNFVDVISKKTLSIDKIRLVDTSAQAVFLSSLQQLQVWYRQLLYRGSYNSEGGSTGNLTPVISYIQLHKNLRVENNGMYFDPSDITVNGYWGELGLADLLPYDYVRPEK